MDQNLPNEEKVIHEPQVAPVTKKPISRKIILLGIAILLIVGLFTIFTILRNQEIKRLTNAPVANTLPTAEILFSSPSVELDAKKPGSVDIWINTGGNHIGGVVIAIKYNPKLLRNVTLENIKDPTSAISQALSPTEKVTYDNDNGAVLMTLRLPQNSPLSGKGTVARLYFTKSPLDIAIDSTDIAFLPITSFITANPNIIPLNKNLTTVELR